MADEAVEKELNRLARIDRVAKYAKSIGATDELAEVFAESQARNFVWDGVNLSFSGRNVVDDDQTKKHFVEGKLSALFPAAKAKDTDKPDIDPALVERARTNLTEKGKLVRQLGSLAAADAVLANKPAAAADDKSKDTNNKGDDRKNPWLAGQWSLLEQGRIIRNPALGLPVAQRLAAAAGVYVGAVRPAKVA